MNKTLSESDTEIGFDFKNYLTQTSDFLTPAIPAKASALKNQIVASKNEVVVYLWKFFHCFRLHFLQNRTASSLRKKGEYKSFEYILLSACAYQIIATDSIRTGNHHRFSSNCYIL